MRGLGALVLALALWGATACTMNPEARKRRALEKGNDLFKAGNHAEAALHYRKAIQIDGKFGEAHYRLGLNELKRGDLASARAHLATAEQLMPENTEVSLVLAELYLPAYLGDARRPKRLYDELVRLSERFLREDPRSFHGLRLKGHLALTDRRPDDAIRLFQEANMVKPYQGEVVVALVKALGEAGRQQEGERLAREMIQRDRGFGPIYDVLYLQYLSAKRPADAERVLLEKVASIPGQAKFVLQLASHYLRQNQREKMAATLQNLLVQPGVPPDTILQVGGFYAAIGEFDEAKRVLETGLDQPANVKLGCQKRIAQILAVEGRKEDAARLIDSILALHPNDREAKALRAALRADSPEAKERKAAVQELRALAGANPDDPVIRMQLGRALFNEGNLSEAQAAFQAIVQRSPNHLRAWLFLSETHLSKKEFDQTVQSANEVLARAPGNASARLLRAFGLMGQRRYLEARRELTALIQDQPGLRAARLQLGMLNIAEKKYAEADAIFGKLYEAGQADPRPLEGLVMSQYAQRQLDQAIQLLSTEIEKAPQNEAARALLAATALQARKPDLALENCRYLAKRQPRSERWQLRLGIAYQQRGELDSAIASYQKAVELAPGTPEPTAFLAQALEAAGRRQEALARYRAALVLQPDNPLLMNNLAHLLAETGGDLEEALQLAQRANRQLPGNPTVTDTLGWISLKKGMPDSAVQVFRVLCEKYPKNPMYRYHLGAALHAKGDRSRARTELLAALESLPATETEGRIRELLKAIQ